MKLDLLYELQPLPRPWARPHPYGQRDAEQKIYEDAFEQVELADRLGFQTAWFVEHHFRDGRSASATPEAVLGGLSRVTRDIRLGFGVTLMPFGFTHPARVAEKVATVDIMSRGRVEWGTGRSTPMEQVAFGVPIDERSKEQWREAVEIVVGMWERERFSWDSPNFHFPERVQTPKPFQDPHPPAWMAASSERSVDLAGSLGLGLLYFTLLQPLEKTREHIATYRAAVGRSSGQLTRTWNDRVGVYTLVHCYDDEDEAAAYGLWDSVGWWYRNWAEFLLEWELPELTEAERETTFPLLKPLLQESGIAVDISKYQETDMIICGTPEHVLEKMIRYSEAGVDQLLCYIQFGDLPHDKVMHNLELLATKVMPELERRGHRTTATATTPTPELTSQ